MAITREYLESFKTNFNKIVYQLLKEKLFVAFGLELTSTKIMFEDNSSFLLKDKTFAYFNPIDTTIHINIEDPFFIKSTSEEQRIAKMIFILFHEAYHRTLMHHERCGIKDKNIWNIACDYEVHNMLYLYEELCTKEEDNLLVPYFILIKEMLNKWNQKNFEPNPKNGEYGCLFDESLLDKIAEEIYQMIMSTAKIETKSYSMDMSAGGSSSDDNNNDSQSSSNDNSEEEDGKNNDSKKDSGDNSEDKEDTQNGSSNDSKSQKQKQPSNSSSGSGSGCRVKVTETTYTLPNGKKHTSVNIEWPEVSQNKSEEQQKNEKDNRELRRQLMEQNLRQEVERSKGNVSQKCEAFLKKLFKIKVDWEKILKSSLQTILSKSDYFTWAKPRTSTLALDMYLPAVCDDSAEYGTLIVARDESGSMSDEEVAKCGAIIADAKEHYKKIIILKHDTDIQFKGEFEELSDEVIKMLCTRATCGGTSHKKVFEFINEFHKRTKYNDEDKISCVILMTDCCSDIQDTQDIIPSEVPMVYLVPENGLEYAKGVKGKIIPIEM